MSLPDGPQFTTATCDGRAVIEVYGDDVGENVLSPFVPELGQLCDDESDDTAGLPEDDYIAAWAAAADDPAFRAARTRSSIREYYIPAMEAADDLGLATALARAELFDTSLQHGPGNDPDGLYALIERTNEAVGTPAEAGEPAWLDAFFDVRIDDLTNPADADTAEDWRQSTERVECVRRIAASGNYDLAGPLTSASTATSSRSSDAETRSSRGHSSRLMRNARVRSASSGVPVDSRMASSVAPASMKRWAWARAVASSPMIPMSTWLLTPSRSSIAWNTGNVA